MKRAAWMSVMGCLCAVLAGISGCEEKQAAERPAAGAETQENPKAEALPATLFLSEPPKGAQDVGAVKSDAKAGEKVVVRGRIGGRVNPFVDGAAVFLLADSRMKSCRELHGDGCKTPWDYCCEPKDSLLAKTVTVQVLGEDGRPVGVGLVDHPKMKPLEEVIIVGEVDRPAGSDVAVVNARGIYVGDSEAPEPMTEATAG